MGLIAADLSAGSLRATLVSPASGAQPPGAQATPLQGANGADVLAELAAAVRALALSADEPVHAVGLAVSPELRPRLGNGAAAGEDALAAALRKAVGQPCAVRVENRATAALLGECWCGAAAGERDAILLLAGEDIQAGILVNGAPLRGSGDLAGGVAWLALARPWMEPYRGVGCFQLHASGRGVGEVARLLLSATPRYEGPLRAMAPPDIRAPHVFAAAARGDSLAEEVLDDAVAFWGMASANLISLFNPRRILFAGELFGPALPLLARVRAEAERWALPAAMRQVELLPAALGEHAALTGAARMALDGRVASVAAASAAAAPAADSAPTAGDAIAARAASVR